MFQSGPIGPGHSLKASKWVAALVGAAVAVSGYATTLPSTQPASDAKAKIISQYGKLPLSFEENRGQSATEVKYVSRGNGYSMFFTPRAAVMSLKTLTATQAIRMRFVGANADPLMSSAQPLPGTGNYYIGNDSRKWRTGVPQYAQIKYKGLYPGVDLIYYGNQRQLEWDFVVAPQADPSVIRIGFSGVDKLLIDEKGDLLLRTKNGALRHRKPVIYQEIAGAREPVDGKYVRIGKDQVGFKVAVYDRTKPLVIDPVLVYSTFVGGSLDDTPRAIAVESAGGNTYITGSTTSTDFPLAGTSPTGGGKKVFVAKLNPAGTQLVYAAYIGGTTGNDNGNAIAIDTAGNAYITGDTTSTDFPATAPAGSSAAGAIDAFVVKLDASGTTRPFGVLLRGSTGNDVGTGIVFDPAGNVVVTGTTNSTNFFTLAPLQAALNNGGGSGGDAFVAKLVAATGSVVFSTYLGGSANDDGNGVALDGSGNIYVVGTTFSTDVPTPGVTPILSGGGAGDAFIAKLNASGSALGYFVYLGGSGADTGTAIAVDVAGNAYVTGHAGADFPTVNAAQSTSGGSGDAFMTKLDTTGHPTLSTFLGGSGNEFGQGIAVDATGQIYVTGYTTSPAGFPLTGTVQQVAGLSDDVFYVKYGPTGTVIYSTVLGGNGADRAAGIAVDGASNAYIAGQSLSTDFPFTHDLRTGIGGGVEGFVVKVGTLSTATTTTLASTPASPTTGMNVALTATVVGGATPPTGPVTYTDGSTILGSATLNASGVATLSMALAQGTHSITATYGGDASNAASASAPVAVTASAASASGGGGGCTVNPTGAVADWTLLMMFVTAGLYRLRRSRQRI